ncbi:MAG: short-chain dehydrogenase, partial [Chlorobi bacterium]|nr:short-chain dehydrogenase [Chlorobiota bacterium]
YYGPNGWQGWRGYPVKVDTNKLAKDKNIAKRLWEVSEDLTGIKFN